MYTVKQRAELAELCYITAERESNKPADKVNNELIETCLRLADMLLGIEHLTEEELNAVCTKIRAKSVHRRKTFRFRIIAAVVALLLVLGTTVYAFSDWIIEIFGTEAVHDIQPGEKIESDNNELEAPENILYFNSIEELVEYVGEPLYIPIGLSEKFKLNKITINEYDSKRIEILWNKDTDIIRYFITLSSQDFNEEVFAKLEYPYYSKDGYPFAYIQIPPRLQAISWINNNDYTIIASNETTIETVIDKMTLIEP